MFSKTVRSLLVAGVAAMGLAACSDDAGSPTQLTQTAALRVAHLSPDAPNVDVYLDGNVVMSDVPYLAVSPFLEVPAGTRTIAVRRTGFTDDLISAELAMTAGGAYTVLATGPVANIAAVVATDDLAAPTTGNVRVRVVHAAPSVSNVDVYVTAPGADIAAASPVLSNVAFRAVSNYLTIAAGDYQIRVTPTGTKTVAIDASVTLTSGQVRTIVAREANGGGAPYDVQLLQDAN